MSNTAASTTTTDFQAGDVVWGRPVVEGKTQARRKGIVLGTFDAARNGFVIWWFGMGDASSDTTSLMYGRELTKAGDIFDFEGARAAKLGNACRKYERAFRVGHMLVRHSRRMLSLDV